MSATFDLHTQLKLTIIIDAVRGCHYLKDAATLQIQTMNFLAFTAHLL